MRVLILGGDGYLGWPTAMRFSGKGHDVAVVDNFNRRRWVEGQGGDSLTPIATLTERVAMAASARSIRAFCLPVRAAGVRRSHSSSRFTKLRRFCSVRASCSARSAFAAR